MRVTSSAPMQRPVTDEDAAAAAADTTCDINAGVIASRYARYHPR